MDKHLFACKTSCANRQRHTRQKVEPLRDHTDQRCHHIGNTALEGAVIVMIALDEKRNTDGNDDDPEDQKQTIHGADHLRLLFLLFFCGFLHQFADIGIFADLLNFGIAFSGNQKTAGKQLISRSFFDLIRLPGEERFIRLCLSGQHTAVRRHLIAAGKQDHIIQHQLFRDDLLLLSVPQHRNSRRIQKRQFIQYLLGMDLLNDTDRCVCQNNRKKRHIPERSGDDQKNCQNGKYQVKIGQKVFFNDLLDTACIRRDIFICLMKSYAVMNLFPGQSADLCFCCHTITLAVSA